MLCVINLWRTAELLFLLMESFYVSASRIAELKVKDSKLIL